MLALVWAGAAGVALGAAGAGTGSVAAVVLVPLALLARRRPGVAGLMALFALGLLAGRVAGKAPNTVLQGLASEVPSCRVEGRITEHAGDLGTLVGISTLRCDRFDPVSNAGTVIAERLDLDPGTTILAEGWLVPLSERDEWDRARARSGADAELALGEVEVVAPPAGLHRVAAAVRASLERATDGLESRRAALVRGLTIGDTTEMDEATEHEFRRTGLSHLVAVSGSNVAIVLAVVAGIVRKVSLGWRTLLCLVALALYVIVVGPEPSVLRAAAMGVVALAGLVWGRRSEPLQALGVALIILLAVRPQMVTSVGLQLSAGATAGIVLWGQSFAAFFARLLPLPIAYALGATVAAQVAVAPLLALVFGQVSLIAPLANLLALPAVAPATVLGLAAAVVGLAVPLLGSALGGLSGPWAGWILGVAETLSRLPWAAVEVPVWVGWALGLLVAAGAVRTLVHSSGASTRVAPWA